MKPSKDLDKQIDTLLGNLYLWDSSAEGATKIEASIDNLKQQLLAIIEQREREARIDELRHCCARCGVWHSETHNISQVRLTFRERIQALQKGKS